MYVIPVLDDIDFDAIDAGCDRLYYVCSDYILKISKLATYELLITKQNNTVFLGDRQPSGRYSTDSSAATGPPPSGP
jgi:hypothetical protein